jgi:dolichyl-phosphate beta-glucosyltransferase
MTASLMDSASPPRPGLTVVIPCYNEAQRLDAGPLLQFATAGAGAALLFVNDGSTDDTGAVLADLAAQHPDRVRVLTMEANSGKAEAVRRGMRDALDGGATVVGYLDADLSTPPDELTRIGAALARPGVEVAVGARVALLGTDIERNAMRHYLGRVFASLASVILQARIYDTQCGAKLFRATPVLAAALSERFISRWAFDIELLGRMLAGAGGLAPLPLDAIVEVPLQTWHDVKGSKLTPVAMGRTLLELGRIGVDLAGRRRAGARR